MLAFPGGRYDDQVDSVSQFLGWITRSQREETVGGCRLFVGDDNHPNGGYWVGNGGYWVGFSRGNTKRRIRTRLVHKRKVFRR
jgi:hypothetical protein